LLETSLSEDSDSVRVAIVQASPVFLDAQASTDKAVQLIGEAADTGAVLAAFGEGWIPGYPMHSFASSGSDLWWEISSAYLQQAIDTTGPQVQALCDAVGERGIDVIIGIAERDPITQGTIYSTQLVIGGEGRVLAKDRKLKASLHERAVWGDADTAGLGVHDRGYGLVSALSGWDNQMMLPAYALAEQGTQFHVMAWPGAETAIPQPPSVPWPRQHLTARAFAAQAGAYVISASGTMFKNDIPEKYRSLLTRELTGDSVVVDPRGEIIAGPAVGESILVAECRMDLLRAAKVAFDVAGHSGRPDLLRFSHPNAPQDDNGFGGQGADPSFGGEYDSGYGPGGYDQESQGPFAGGWTSEPPPGWTGGGKSGRR
jgi:nitrilase